MGDTRVSQSGAKVLAEFSSAESRVSQAGAKVLAEFSAEETRVSQAGAKVLVTYSTEEARISQVGARVLVDYHPCLTGWVQCWKITRTDGTIFAYTSHDKTITHMGQAYTPCYSLQQSALQLGQSLNEAGSVDLTGIIDDDNISEADLQNGLFDNAEVEIWLVPFIDNVAAQRLSKGQINKTGFGKFTCNMEILTYGALLQQRTLVETFTPGCRWTDGILDSRCPVDEATFLVTGTVTQATDIIRNMFQDTGRTEADGWFDFGLLTWTSGANIGKQSEVKTYASDTFLLWEEMANPIEVGDTYEVYAGCDQLAPTCKTKFNAYIGYGGFMDIPGQDELFQTPDSKQ